MPPPPHPAARTRRRRGRIAARAADAVLLAALLGALGLYGSVPATARLAGENPTSTAFIDLRRAEAAAAGKPFTLRWQWRPLGAISRYLRAAVIYAEDDNFYRHDGVDWHALEHAVSADWNKGAMSVGGSTITQQLAKNLYLSPRRSLVRKLREVLIAFSLEDHLTKQRILELYLNVVEWGDGIYGAGPAARAWFGKSPRALRVEEAAWLAGILRHPRRAVLANSRPAARDTTHARWVLDHMRLSRKRLAAAKAAVSRIAATGTVGADQRHRYAMER